VGWVQQQRQQLLGQDIVPARAVGDWRDFLARVKSLQESLFHTILQQQQQWPTLVVALLFFPRTLFCCEISLSNVITSPNSYWLQLPTADPLLSIAINQFFPLNSQRSSSPPFSCNGSSSFPTGFFFSCSWSWFSPVVFDAWSNPSCCCCSSSFLTGFVFLPSGSCYITNMCKELFSLNLQLVCALCL
jgi:hypothetical protein